MYILGLNVYHGDSSACLLKDGELVCAFEEERFTRKKHWAGFPILSIKECLKEANINITDIDFITTSRNLKENFGKKVLHALRYQTNVSSILQRAMNSRKVGSLEQEFSREFGIDAKFFKNKINNIEHHRSHLASSFFASPYKDAAILSIDAFGDFCSTMLAKGSNNNIEVLEQVLFPHSIGIFYTAFTQYLGFPYFGDEYKVMGLAPLGQPKFLKEMEDIVVLDPQGLFSLNLDYFVHHKQGVKTKILEENDPTPSLLFSKKMIEKFGPVRKKQDPITQFHKDLAASVQRYCETVIFHVMKRLHTLTGNDRLCVAGGVAQNSVANGKITTLTPFKEVYIPPAGHDAGTSIGSALYLYNQVLKKERVGPMFNPYTGSKSSNQEIENLLKSRKIQYERFDDMDLFEIVSERLVQGGVVGWFQGRAEFGPRALGGRSILADPRNPNAKDLLNSKIKRRESFRPFAPSILKDYTSEFFTITDSVPFMEKVFPIRPEKQSKIPAVTHIDGTGRLQTVDEKVSPKYYKLIEAFRRKTGIPILLNTSFNENEPIVNTPTEALECYLRTNMDMLVLENCVVTRNG